MLSHGKFNLARFKRGSHGILEFAILLEQASLPTREQILATTREQDPEFLYQVMRRVVFFEELTYLEETVLSEIIRGVSPKVLAFSLRGMPEDFRRAMLGNLPYQEMRRVMDEDEKAGEPTSQLVEGARKHVLKTARQIEAQGRVILELTDCPRLCRPAKG